MSRAHNYSHSRANSPTFPSLHPRHNSFSNTCVALPTSQLILQPFRRYTYVTAHTLTLPSLYLCHSSFSNPSVALPASQLILQPSVVLPTSQLLLQPFHRFTYVSAQSQSFRCFTYVTAYSPTLPSLHLRHSSFSNPFVVLRTSQFILQPFFRFSCVTGYSLTSPGALPMM